LIMVHVFCILEEISYNKLFWILSSLKICDNNMKIKFN
jgi:hypothetical protein